MTKQCANYIWLAIGSINCHDNGHRSQSASKLLLNYTLVPQNFAPIPWDSKRSFLHRLRERILGNALPYWLSSPCLNNHLLHFCVGHERSDFHYVCRWTSLSNQNMVENCGAVDWSSVEKCSNHDAIKSIQHSELWMVFGICIWYLALNSHTQGNLVLI